MRNLPAALLALLLPAAWAAPQDGLHRPDPPPAMGLDPGEDPLSPEGPALRLLWSAAERLRPPEPAAADLTREQALLYLLALHDHDRSRRLDGLELLQLLSQEAPAAAAQRPGPEAVALLVDRLLEAQDLDGDGLLDPSELLRAPGEGRGLVRWPEPPAAAGAAAGPPGPEPAAALSPLGLGPAEGQGLPGGAAPPEAEAAAGHEAVEAEAAPAPGEAGEI
ncbi:cell growth regulator with EF hand domain protein 1 [Struthio camelus]|uniref:cell growth regulator with EF hand domain protein 1 n=1 Tax=Struthio camelus TaxID=8801 RepID=UPI003603FB73